MSEPVEPMIEGPRSAEDLASLYDKLSVQQFQRGLVWDSRSVALLFHANAPGELGGEA